MVSLTTLLIATALSAEPVDLTGTWRLDWRVVSRNRVPVIGRITTSSEAWALARVEDNGHGLSQEQRLCGGLVRAGAVQSQLPPEYIASVPPKTYDVRIQAEGDQLTFQADTGKFWSGHDPTCAHLPEDADDPCVTDWDSDGQPGATVKVKAPLFKWVDVYVAQRTHLVLNGRVTSADRIEGLVEMWQMDTHVLAATNRLFARNPKVWIVPEESRFTMVRVDDETTCADFAPPRNHGFVATLESD